MINENKIMEILQEEGKKFANDSQRAMQRLVNKILKNSPQKCQTMDCKKNAIIKVREGFHWYWVCKPCMTGKIPLEQKGGSD